jgi:hypothetical protein
MDLITSAILVVVGVLLIFFSLASVFRTVVLPRAAFDPMTRAIFLGFRSFLLWLSGLSDRFLDREVALSVHAPLGLLTMALAWAVGIMLGFTLLFAATGPDGLQDAFVLAGSSFTTLGFSGPESRLHEVLAVVAAVLGLGVVALLISYLPTIYGLFSRREVVVADISIRSGGVAHGPDLMRHLIRGADTTRLDDMWADWGHWFITLGETHTSEPSLNFFRSPRPRRSWLTAATAILDAAVLRNVVIAAPTSVRAEMTYRSGREALVGIAHFFFVRPDGEDDYFTVLTRADFDVEIRELEKDGIPLVDDLDAAWDAFAKQRSAYEPHVLGLARLILPPPAPWASDLLQRPQSETGAADSGD